MAKQKLTENIAEQTPSGGVLVGKRNGQTMIHNKGSLSGYLVGKTHAEGGIKAVNESTGQPLEMQGGEVVITAPAVSDQTKREFEGKMMTNREILSEINSKGGGVSFADGGDVPKSLKYTGASYKFGGKVMSDHDILMHINKGHLANGKTLKQIAKMHGVTLLDINKQVKIGLNVESEHTSSSREQLKIVKDHLVENPEYYTLLKKAGLKKGGVLGKTQKENLVKNSEKGDTPARDLNNYNDVLDLEADGAVGGNDGLTFADGGDLSVLDGYFDLGGNVGMPEVEYITVSSVGNSIHSSFTGKKFYSYIEMATALAKLFSDNNKRMGYFYFTINDSYNKPALQFKDGKNTVLNFNPLTGNYKDFEKQIERRFSRTSKLYNWKDWLSGKKSTPISQPVTASGASKPIDLKMTKIWIGDNPKLSEEVQKKAFELGYKWYGGDTNIVKYTDASALFFNNQNGISFVFEKDFFDSEKEYKEILASDLLGNGSTGSQSQASSGKFTQDEVQLFEDIKDYVDRNGLKVTDAGLNKSPDSGVVEFIDKGKNVLRQFITWRDYFSYEVDKNPISKEIVEKYLDWEWEKDQSNISVSASASASSNLLEVPDSIPNFSELVKDLPSAVMALFLIRTIDQGIDVSKIKPSTTVGNLISWIDTEEGNIFWGEISKGNFIPFKKKYGKYGEKVKATVVTPTQPTTAQSTVVTPTQPTTAQSNLAEVPDLIPLKYSSITIEELPPAVLGLALIRGNDQGVGIRWFESKSNLNTIYNRDNGDFFDFSKTEEGFDFWLKITKGDFREFKEKYGKYGERLKDAKPNYAQAPVSQSNLLTDLLKTKIWVGGDTELSKRVQERAFELGWSWMDGKTVQSTESNALYFEQNYRIMSGMSRVSFNEDVNIEIFADQLFGDASVQSMPKQSSQTNAPLPTRQKIDDEFVADDFELRKNEILSSGSLKQDRDDLDALAKLLPSFQESRFAVEKASILKEMERLNNKITYKGFIASNEEVSKGADLFTPQGLLKYYFTQTTQNPTAELQPACELPTPNGEKSKLPMSAYLNVRSSQFKKWFGDWEKAYETGNYMGCSKMIDEETKEPKIFFHGVRKYIPSFGQMSNMGSGVVRPYGSFEPPNFPASYFADNESYANFYGGIAENMPKPSPDYKPFIYKVFLSIKNPISLLPLDFEVSYRDLIDYIFVAYGIRVSPSKSLLSQLENDMDRKHPMWVYIRRDIGLIETLKEYGYDALIQQGDIPVFDKNGEVVSDRNKFIKDTEYLSFYPSQVKSATVKKSFYFNFFNDIRFKKGGYVCI